LIIFSSEGPFETNRILKTAGSFEGTLFYFLHLSLAPSSSSIKVDSSSDNSTRISPLVVVDHAPTTSFATEADTLSPGLSISHMSLVTHSPLSPSLLDAIIQVPTESEQYISDSSLGLFANTRNPLIAQASGTFTQLEVQVMDMRKKLLVAEHSDTLTSMANLAGTYLPFSLIR